MMAELKVDFRNEESYQTDLRVAIDEVEEGIYQTKDGESFVLIVDSDGGLMIVRIYLNGDYVFVSPSEIEHGCGVNKISDTVSFSIDR